MEVSNKVLKDKLEQDIEKGKYRIGKLIVPKTFTKTVCKNNSLVTEEFLVSGRKLSIDDIRADMYENHKAFMRLTTDQEYLALSRETIIDGLKRIDEFNDDYENRSVLHLRETFKKFERTRHLMFWHDGSSLSNHGHILMLISVMYDKAIFFNNDEYYEKYGVKINIQAIVEKPFLYILARCPSNDEQLEYTNLRIENIISLKYPIIVNNNIEIFVVLRIFKGDHPASQFESGQNKGGNFPCHGCSLFAPKAKSYSYSFRCKTLSLKQRVEKIFQTNLSKDNFKHGKIYLYKNLSKSDIISQLLGRNLQFKVNSNKKNLKSILDKELHGIQRLPALMCTKSFDCFDSLNLAEYEILVNEPLHDVYNHIKNIQKEIPFHLEKRLKPIVQQIISDSFDSELKNSGDHRKSLLVITKWFQEHQPFHFICTLLTQLSEIQEILYLGDDFRKPIVILRLLITTFLHSIFTNIYLKRKISSMSERKYFGIYYHSLIRHSGEQFRLFSGRSCNSEKQEAFFHPLKEFTNLTSNRNPDNIILNNIIRIQSKKLLNNEENNSQLKESKLYHLYSSIKQLYKNHVIHFTIIEQYPWEYQSMLENIADYLVEGKWWSETNNGVVFFDLENDSLKKLTHFRSTSITKNNKHIASCWIKCLEDLYKIPALKITINGNIVKLGNLKYSNHVSLERIESSTEILIEIIKD
ncbi:uncharacterized protein LOC101239424 [Hydra vulgaris]|uniref:uncharacterized protein LOC101239424 n=1 Tax=Hydra vulgaris TaxID=6087 RepID=UPI001F5E8192|nr:uncharacterized protein LOC101239424 [Hydra vulgaris]